MIKHVSDYLDDVHKNYPFLTKDEVLSIMKYVTFHIQSKIKIGSDINIISGRHNLRMHIGKITFNLEKKKAYWIRKMQTKIRYLYNRNKCLWDGYYYFAISDKYLSDILKQKNKVGNPRKYFNFGNVVFYKIFEECLLREQGKYNIFRIPMIVDLGYKFYKENYRSKDFEYIYRQVLGGLQPIGELIKCDNNILKHNYRWLYWKPIIKE